MSTFPGRLVEFPGVSIDRFDGENRESTVFFLSHCHTDHMVGLGNTETLPGPLYVSDISAVILRQRWPHLRDIRVLELGETQIPISGVNVTVTTIPAGHCPGSVMFLFESPTCKVLYTGDFRLREKDIPNICAFDRIRGKLDNLYVDSTFLSKSFENFPSRIESTDAIVKLTQEWISKSSNHIVWLRTPAHYGSEYLFMEIHKRIRKPLHIDPENLSNYIYIPDMDGVFTVDGEKSPIHACWRPGCAIVRYGGKEVREIVPTAMFWRNWKDHCNIVMNSKEHEKTPIRVCYSSHASLSELRDFITFLQPKNVQLNVIPENPQTRAEAYSILRDILAEKSTETTCLIENEDDEVISFKNIKLKKKQIQQDDSDEASMPILLPKRKKRKV